MSWWCRPQRTHAVLHLDDLLGRQACGSPADFAHYAATKPSIAPWLDRLRVAQRRTTADRGQVQAAFDAHFAAYGLPAHPVYWLCDWTALWDATWLRPYHSQWARAWVRDCNEPLYCGELFSRPVNWHSDDAHNAAWSLTERQTRMTYEITAANIAHEALGDDYWRAAWPRQLYPIPDMAASLAAKAVGMHAHAMPDHPVVRRFRAIHDPLLVAFEAGLWMFSVIDNEEVLAIMRPIEVAG
jgi:hypothetical protein